LKLETGITLVALALTGGIAIYAIWKYTAPAAPTPPPEPPPTPPDYTEALQNINDNITSQIPEGTTENRKVLVSGDAVEMLTEDRYRGLNWISCDITNIGPGVLYYDVNEWRNPEHPLQVGGSVSVNLGQKGAIKKLFFSSNAGTTTEASVDGLA